MKLKGQKKQTNRRDRKMKDEEQAEEYAKKQNLQNVNPSGIVRCKLADVFLAGLKAGRPQWHDLRKDKTDLPDTDRIVYVQTMSDTGKAYHDSDGWYSTQVSGIVIAWCELPTFDKEKDIKSEMFPEITLPKGSAELVDKVIADAEKRLKESE